MFLGSHDSCRSRLPPSRSFQQPGSPSHRFSRESGRVKDQVFADDEAPIRPSTYPSGGRAAKLYFAFDERRAESRRRKQRPSFDRGALGCSRRAQRRGGVSELLPGTQGGRQKRRCVQMSGLQRSSGSSHLYAGREMVAFWAVGLVRIRIDGRPGTCRAGRWYASVHDAARLASENLREIFLSDFLLTRRSVKSAMRGLSLLAPRSPDYPVVTNSPTSSTLRARRCPNRRAEHGGCPTRSATVASGPRSAGGRLRASRRSLTSVRGPESSLHQLGKNGRGALPPNLGPARWRTRAPASSSGAGETRSSLQTGKASG